MPLKVSLMYRVISASFMAMRLRVPYSYFGDRFFQSFPRPCNDSREPRFRLALHRIDLIFFRLRNEYYTRQQRRAATRTGDGI